jgi:ankyrin repeat protein
MNTLKNFAATLIIFGLSLKSFAGSTDDLVAACMKGDLAAAQKAIDAGADVNGKNSVGWSPIVASIFWPELTQLLLDKKADPNLGDSPALVNAAGLGSYEVIKLLLKAGADPNKPIGGDPTANFQRLLDEEKAKGKAANKYMIKAYEDGIANAKKGNISTTYALQNVVNKTLCNECLEELIKSGAKTDVMSSSANGNLLDDLAFSALPAADWIENNKAQAGGWEKLGFTLPDWYKNPDAKKLSSVDAMVKTLVKAGVNINAENKLKNTPLLTSLGRSSQTKSEIVLAFVNNGSNVNVENFKGHALLQAAGYGFPDALEAMFAKGADMNMEFKVNDIENGQRLKGITPLMWAARNGKLDAVKLLVEKGAKLNEAAYGNSFNIKTNCMTTVKNKTAIFYAIEGENLDVVKYLVESTKGDWSGVLIVNQWKKEREDAMFIYMSCIDDGSYKPSKYAKVSNQPQIADYLKSKNL